MFTDLTPGLTRISMRKCASLSQTPVGASDVKSILTFTVTRRTAFGRGAAGTTGGLLSLDFSPGPSSCAPRIRARKYAAQIQRSATVSQATSEELRAKGFVAPGTADG